MIEPRRFVRPLILCAGLAGAFAPSIAQAQVVVVPPPPPRVEVVPPLPYPGAVWSPGYWTWRGRRHVCDVGLEARLRHAQRPQAHGLAGGEAAGGALAGLQARAHQAAARHRGAGGQRRVVEVRLQLRDHHRRRRRQVAGVDQLQQVLREARVLGVLLVVDARGEEREALQQALDVGVDAFAARDGAVQGQARGDLRVLAREFSRRIADVQQFLAVVAEESGIHRGSRVGMAGRQAAALRPSPP